MKNKTPKKKESTINFNTNKFFYPLLITVIWFVTYLVCTLVWEQKLGWDEVAYMSVAKGIATDFDFSARAYTIMGLLKFGYPTTLINFPVFSAYIAIFFKLFGTTLHVAYFSTWLAALGVCLLIYFIFLLLSDDDHKAAFIVSLSYLFFPGIIKNCDSAMMEQCGCLLLCLSIFLILKDYIKGKFDFFTVLKFALSFLVLWLYKSLYIGYFFGAFLFICFAYSSVLGKKIDSKLPLPLFVGLSYGLFAILFYIAQKFIFLPVTPMMSFTPDKDANQTYADFLGGFFNNFPRDLIVNWTFTLKNLISAYFIYPTNYMDNSKNIFGFTSEYVLLGIYFFLFFIMLFLFFAFKEKLSPQAKLFFVLTYGTIISFNIIFNSLFLTTLENEWRYNMYSLPLYLCCLGLILKNILESLNQFIVKHQKVTFGIVGLCVLAIYIPLSLSMINSHLFLELGYHYTAKFNSDFIKSVIKDSNPGFYYYNDGTHLAWDMYPLKQVFKDATNDQLLQVNKILPKPIDYLFLKPRDWLFQNNQKEILKGEPIINGNYNFIGVNKDLQIVVYKRNKEI